MDTVLRYFGFLLLVLGGALGIWAEFGIFGAITWWGVVGLVVLAFHDSDWGANRRNSPQ